MSKSSRQCSIATRTSWPMQRRNNCPACTIIPVSWKSSQRKGIDHIWRVWCTKVVYAFSGTIIGVGFWVPWAIGRDSLHRCCLLLRGSSRRRAALCSVRGIPYQSAGQGVSTHLLSCDQQSFVWSSTALPTGYDDLLNSVSIEVRSLWLIVLAQC